MHSTRLRPLALALALVALAASAPAADAAPAGWLPTAALGGGAPADGPVIAMARTGDGVVAWTRGAGSDPREADAAIRRRDGTFRPAERLSPPGVSVQSSTEPVAVAVDDDGDVAAIWVGDVGAAEVVQVRVRPHGGAWGPVETLVPAADADQVRVPALLFEKDGTLTAAWGQDTTPGVGDGFRIVTRHRTADGIWGAPRPLSAGGAANANYVRLGRDSDGDVVAVWLRGSVLETMDRPVDGDWPASPTPITPGGQQLFSPRLEVGGNGAVLVVWERLIGGRKWLIARLRGAGTAFPDAASPAETVYAGIVYGAREWDVTWPEGTAPVVAVSADTPTPGTQVVRVTHRQNDGSWSQADVISAQGDDAEAPAVSAGRNGRLVVAWRAAGGIQHATGAADALVRPADALLSSRTRPAFRPVLASLYAGQTTLAFLQDDAAGDLQPFARSEDVELDGRATLTSAWVRATAKRRVRVAFACPALERSCAFQVRLRTLKKLKLPGQSKRLIKLGTRSRVVGAGATPKLTFTLPPKLVKRLNARKRIMLLARVVVTDAAGNTRTELRQVLMVSRTAPAPDPGDLPH